MAVAMARKRPRSSSRSMQDCASAIHWWKAGQAISDSMTAWYRACLDGKWRKTIASVTPAAAAISFVVAPLNPFWENTLRAASRSWERRSEADIRVGWRGETGMASSKVSKCLLTCQGGGKGVVFIPLLLQEKCAIFSCRKKRFVMEQAVEQK